MVTMEESAMVEGGKKAKRNLGTEYSVGSTTLPLGAILGIAIGGALLLFTLLVTVGVMHVKRKHRRESNNVAEASEDGNADIDLKTALRSTRPPPTSLVQRLSFNPFLPHSEQEIRDEWDKHDGLRRTPLAKSKTTSQRGFFRTSSIRDSWPLMSKESLGLPPGQTAMFLSPVAPPGYVVQDQKWPNRSTSLLGRKRSLDSSKSVSPTRETYAMDIMPYRKIHRRSTSENQLSTILRSTSQRLKAAQRQSMTRTLSTLGRFPGLPPSDRLPTPPPLGNVTENREELMDQELDESVTSSIYDIYAQTPSPKKKHQRTSSKRSQVKSISLTESVKFKDNLRASESVDMPMSAPLTSPSKNSSGLGQKSFSNKAVGRAKDISAQIHQDHDVSMFATDLPNITSNQQILSPPQRISLSGDPFYSSVRSSKPVIPSPQIQGPRPMYFRKTTFGQEVTSERPAGFNSPLRDVSGNVQASPKRGLPEPKTNAESNPFQWYPQEAIPARATQNNSKKSNSRRKGHKRSNVIRMSNLSRPTSSVDIVPEEPEEASPLMLNGPKYSSFPRVEITQCSSPTQSPSSQRTSQRPPSIPIFNPTLILPITSTGSEDVSPALGVDRRSDTGYSPTLSVCNYYTEKDSGSEDDFFEPRISTSLQPSPSAIKYRRHERNYSADLALMPTHQSHQYLQEQLLSSSPLLAEIFPAKIVPPTQILTSRPTSPSLPNSISTMSGLRSSAATPAPPMLTVPNHLTGPRSEPGKHTRATLSPPRCESMLSTISMLRRMNSEVSTASSNSVTSAESPTMLSDALFPSTGNNTNTGLGMDVSIIEEDDNASIKVLNSNTQTSIEERGRSRGSRHYLSMGQGQSPPSTPSSSAPTRVSEKATMRQARHTRPRVEIRDSHRIHKERRKKRAEEMDGAGMVDELEAVQEGSSPATGVNSIVRGSGGDGKASGSDIGLRFPILSSEGRASDTSPRFGERSPARLSGLRLVAPEIEGLTTDFVDAIMHPDKDSSLLQSIESDTQFQPEDTQLDSLGKASKSSVLTEKNGNEGQVQWSDAVTEPSTHAIRRESKMEHPSPVTPPK
ncbi:hypothetical protein VTL71DRAFT_2002 [Oculimacula yallundae]|uniref:Uncharacterized protein n=1 Tax=Oculimacula yallundae TaxID=86028 RepID=A0ABR4CDI0_9HELO